MWYFSKIINNVLHAIKPTKIIEIGCLDGIGTRSLLNGYIETAPQSQLISIDPKPRFDVHELKEKFGELFVMIEDYSLQVLPNLIPCDFVLLDGDHNWYTVYHELKILEKCSRFPITFLHDLEFPAARRDVYYFPDSIPKEHLKPYAYKFPIKGQHKLSEHSSAPHFAFAEYEGGEKNGALTAVEDFLRETKHPLLLHRIHSSFGLGILVPSESEQDREWNHIVYNSIMSWTEGRDYLYSQYRYPI